MHVNITAHFPKEILINLFNIIKVNILKSIKFSHGSHLEKG